MNIKKKDLTVPFWKRNPKLEITEVEKRVLELRRRLDHVHVLMKNWDEEEMRYLLSSLTDFVKNYKTMKEDVGKNALTGFGGCVGVLVGLFNIVNPVGRLLMLGGGLVMMGAGFSRASDVDDDNKRNLCRMLERIEIFQAMGVAIDHLEDVCRRYLNFSVLSKEGKQFFLEAATESSGTKECSNLDENDPTVQMPLLLNKIEAVQDIIKIRDLLKTYVGK